MLPSMCTNKAAGNANRKRAISIGKALTGYGVTSRVPYMFLLPTGEGGVCCLADLTRCSCSRFSRLVD
jgi:hypothetical protein